jgi:hypothetical protein
VERIAIDVAAGGMAGVGCAFVKRELCPPTVTALSGERDTHDGTSPRAFVRRETTAVGDDVDHVAQLVDVDAN